MRLAEIFEVEGYRLNVKKHNSETSLNDVTKNTSPMAFEGGSFTLLVVTAARNVYLKVTTIWSKLFFTK